MYTQISQDVFYVGVNDHQIDLFEGQYKVPNGMSYNSYVIADEKVAVMDTVDARFSHEWLENLNEALNGRAPDYLVVQHMEPDHSASVCAFVERHPGTTVVSNAKVFSMLQDFYGLEVEKKVIVANGGTLELGRHTLTFVFAPMVHWPEVMVTYDAADKLLFSADAFGKFGALDVEEDWTDEARRYYIGIVGKYGAPVQVLLKKAAALDIAKICPLHGPVLTDNIADCIAKYDIWSSYKPEEDGILVAYTSIYGNTRKAVSILIEELQKKGCKVTACDLARSDLAENVANAFRFNKLVLATTTYNGDIFPFMREFIEHLTERNFQNRTVGMIENGAWAPAAARIMKEMLSGCANLTLLEKPVTIKGGINGTNIQQLQDMAAALADA